MSQWPSSQECPVDLHYAEPQPRQLDVGLIIGRGRRIRRRRTLTRAAAGLVACAAIASVLTGIRGFTVSFFPHPAGPATASGQAPPIDAQIAADPPWNGKLTLVSRWPQHWTTVAWATRSGAVCWATYRTPMRGATEELECPPWTAAEIPGEGTGKLSWLMAVILPTAPGSSDQVPWVGLVTPRATRVTVTFFGRTFTAKVIPVPLRNGHDTGIFTVWLTLPAGITNYGSNRITSEVAYNQAGRIVARTGAQP